MSTCGDCDCADKSQCKKQGSSYTVDIVETDKSFGRNVVEVAPAAFAENDGKCKCGAGCACVDCTCGH
ncbi:cystathionine beta-lyase [Asimina triloba]